MDAMVCAGKEFSIQHRTYILEDEIDNANYAMA